MFFQTLMVIWILRCFMGNNSGFKVDEPALGQWVRVFRKGRKNRKDIQKNAIFREATKKSSFSLGQIPGAASLTVAPQPTATPKRMAAGKKTHGKTEKKKKKKKKKKKHGKKLEMQKNGTNMKMITKKNPLFEEECRQDPVFLQQLCSLERMLQDQDENGGSDRWCGSDCRCDCRNHWIA